MVLEAAFLCVDNSDYMRNGDFAPSRMEAQLDAVNLLSGAKTQSNPENTVGLLATAGRGVEVQVALTADIGKILSLSHGIKVGGLANLSAGIQVAQLSLKHRQNKNQRQRIIVFVGSPVNEEESALVKLGKKLKKNSVALDIINFGEEAENAAKLEALLNAVNSDDNSHLVTIPPGPHVLSDILLSSPIVQGEDGAASAVAAAAGGGGGGDGFTEFGVDPNMDPEFAYALRISMEEERARQEAESKKREEEEGTAAGEGGAAASSAAAEAGAGEGAGSSAEATEGAKADEPMAGEPAEVDEAALLEAALAMSMPAELATPTAAPPPVTPGAPGGEASQAGGDSTGGEAMDVDAEDDDEAMQLALAMSMSNETAESPPAEPPAAASAAAAPAAPESDLSAVLRDASFLQSVLGSLPGVDTSDPRIQSVLNSAKPPEEGDKEDKEKPP